jgi:aspartyl protease family protein
MKQILAFAFVAMVLAGVMPRVMSRVGADAPEAAQQAARTASSASQSQSRSQSQSKPQSSGPRSVTLLSDRRGHFQVEGAVDGRNLDFMVDTGATVVALREGDAGKLGIFPRPRDYTGLTSTANGTVRVAPVRLSSVEIRGIRIYDVQAVVIPDQALSVNLLGMSFLSRVRFEMANGRLTMEQ